MASSPLTEATRRAGLVRPELGQLAEATRRAALVRLTVGQLAEATRRSALVRPVRRGQLAVPARLEMPRHPARHGRRGKLACSASEDRPGRRRRARPDRLGRPVVPVRLGPGRQGPSVGSIRLVRQVPTGCRRPSRRDRRRPGGPLARPGPPAQLEGQARTARQIRLVRLVRLVRPDSPRTSTLAQPADSARRADSTRSGSSARRTDSDPADRFERGRSDYGPDGGLGPDWLGRRLGPGRTFGRRQRGRPSGHRPRPSRGRSPLARRSHSGAARTSGSAPASGATRSSGTGRTSGAARSANAAAAARCHWAVQDALRRRRHGSGDRGGRRRGKGGGAVV